MTLRKQCSAWLGLAGACLFVIGCGGGDVPDPESDSQAASGSAPAGGGAPAAAPAAAPAVAAADAPKAQEAAPADAPPAQSEPPKDQPKGQGGSTTTEMLALAGGNSPAPPAEAAPAAPGAPGGAAPPGGAPPNAGPGARGGGMQGMTPPGGSGGPGPGGGGMRMGPGSPGQQGMDPSKQMAGMQQQMQAQMQKNQQMQPGMAGRGAGMAGGDTAGAGGGGANNVDQGPADTSSARGAVRTFLSALKAKDADRLSEATAQRAATDSSAKNRETFTKILEVSLSDSELDGLAKSLDGYQIAGENPPKSTGKIDVVIQKSGDNGGYSRRRVTARREKKGWGVLDISPEQRFPGMGGRRVTKQR
jgi:hypothetical protein